MNTAELGHVGAPEGILIILDPGLARFWRHDGEPVSPREGDPEQTDLEIVGPDAEAAGRAYDRSFDPLHLFDRTKPEAAVDAFGAFAAQRGFDARALPCARRIPHTRRVEHALRAGDGLGVVIYNGLWAAAVGGLPADRPLPVVAERIPSGEFEGRFRHIDVVVDPDVAIARRQTVPAIMVDHGQFLFAGLGPLGEFKAWESRDGLADYVFWGPDAAGLAASVAADALDGDTFGWRDVPVADVGSKAQPIQKRIDEEGLRVAVDYRPHCNLERINAQIRSAAERTAELDLAGSPVVGCSNRWGDGIFEVSRLFDDRDRLVRVRVELATDKRMELTRMVTMRHRGAIVSRKILDQGEPVRFADRDAPRNDADSGWSLFSGTESDAYARDPKNFAVVRVDTMIGREPALEAIILAPAESRFRRVEGKFVAG